ncbi:MAG: 3'-5' exonuclease [Candidatus Eremiobacteraeota bacterium]|nr:3'-5' exonuclease [Candidatus Eremiobacteraeota bacterium]
MFNAFEIATTPPPLRAVRYAVVDVETTGFSPRDDRVVEVACLILDRDGALIDEFASLVCPGRRIPYYASAVHGIHDADVADAPSLNALAPVLQAMVGDAVIVAHNAGFDRGFLPFFDEREWLCTMRLARRYFPHAPRHTNQALRAYLGIRDPRLENMTAHRALADVLVTAGILRACLRRKAALAAIGVARGYRGNTAAGGHRRVFLLQQ